MADGNIICCLCKVSKHEVCHIKKKGGGIKMQRAMSKRGEKRLGNMYTKSKVVVVKILSALILGGFNKIT